MNKHTFLFAVFLATKASMLFAAGDNPMPAFLPSTPAATKAISAYTAGDVLGIVSTNPGQLPAGHPYIADKKYATAIRTDWPGAKDAANIDALVQILLDAPPVNDPTDPLASEIEGAWGNVEIIIVKVMDVADSAKADALLRVINAQTDPGKKLSARIFGWMMFDKLLDPRLLGLRLEDLDDASAHDELFHASEESPKHRETTRSQARNYLFYGLENVLGMTLDKTPFEVEDEAAGCAALKSWFTANLNLISTKCAEKKSNPSWQPQLSFQKTWDPRW